MSCGDPHETDCAEVLERVYHYLDQEMLDEHQRHEVREHLDECAPCLRQFGLEREFLALVAKRCGGDVAPSHVRETLRLKLQQVRVELTSVEYRAD